MSHKSNPLTMWGPWPLHLPSHRGRGAPPPVRTAPTTARPTADPGDRAARLCSQTDPRRKRLLTILGCVPRPPLPIVPSTHPLSYQRVRGLQSLYSGLRAARLLRSIAPQLNRSKHTLKPQALP